MSPNRTRQRICGDYHLLDKQIGFRIQLKRVLESMSEKQIADILCLDPLHISEFEQGVRPISASMLYHLSVVLRIPIANFFDSFSDSFDLSSEGDSDAKDDGPLPNSHEKDKNLLNEHDVIELFGAYSSIRDDSTRRRMVDLMKAVAQDQ